MLVHFYFSNDTFIDLIRYRVLDAYRPVVSPFGGGVPYMDGLENVQMTILSGQNVSGFDFQLNVPGANPGQVVPAPGVVDLSPPSITLSFDAQLFLVAESDLPSSPDPATGVFSRPKRFALFPSAKIKIFMATGAGGVPVLKVQPFDLNIPGATPSSFAQDVPLPLTSVLGQIIGPNPLILNTGLARTADQAGMVIRIEANDPQLSSPGDRVAAWNSFFAGQQPSRLGIRAWAAEAPTGYLVQQVQSFFENQMRSAGVEKYFSNYDPSSANWVSNNPQMTLSQNGVFQNACSGLDIQATITVALTLSVPQTNTLRLNLHLDITRDAWDSFKCALFSLLNPLSGLITWLDHSQIPWYAGLPLSVLGQLAIPLAMTYLAFTGNTLLDTIALQEVQNDASKQGYNLIRTSDTDAYLDTTLPLDSLNTAAFLNLQEIAAIEDRVIFRGDYRPPDFATPLFVKGTLVNGFSFWQKDKCAAPRLGVFKTVATLQLTLSDPNGKMIPHPAIATKCGIDSNSGITECWRVVDDLQGVYSGANTNIDWTGAGVPGVFEITVSSPTVDFLEHPYPLNLQLFTNYGSRQFTIQPPPAPPQIPSNPEQSIAEAAGRISECYAISSLIALIKALQIVWLPYPLPDFRVAQHWQVQVEGLTPGDRLRAWDPVRGELLAEVTAWGGTFAELSLVNVGPAMQLLQITLNDQPMLSVDEYNRLAAGVDGKSETALNPVRIGQTSLLHLTEIPLPERAGSVQLRSTNEAITITAWGQQNTWQISLQPRATRTWTIVRIGSPPAQRNLLPSANMSLAHSIHEGRQLTRLLDPAGSEIGRFFVRPWYDRGAIAGRYYLRLDDDGDSVTLYGRLVPATAYPQTGPA